MARSTCRRRSSTRRAASEILLDCTTTPTTPTPTIAQPPQQHQIHLTVSANANPSLLTMDAASVEITIDFLRSYEVLKGKSDEQLDPIVTKLKDQLIDTAADLTHVSRSTLQAANIPGLAIDALKPEKQPNGKLRCCFCNYSRIRIFHRIRE